MRVLLTNDDGIYAPGLWALAEKLTSIAQIIVVAPDREKSGIGTAVSLHRPLRIKKVRPSIEKVECYVVDGTPADCVILALETVCSGKKIDLLVSGINEGSNLGHDIFISGTVGGALHGFFHGIPSVALSIAALENLNFEAASRAGAVLTSSLPKGPAFSGNSFILNINFPNLQPDKIKGIQITRIGRRSYTETVKEESDGKRKYFWIRRGREISELEDGTDIQALKKERISITPLFSSISTEIMSGYLAELCSEIKTELNIKEI